MINTDEYTLIKDHSVAPYNFVSLPEKSIVAYESFEELPGHNTLSKDKLNGYIEYEITNKTPLIVGKEKDDDKVVEQFKNTKGEAVIPGNTLRGIVRNNVAILSLSNISEDIEDSRFYFRSFGKGQLNKDYKDRLDIDMKVINGDNVNAPNRIHGGFIYKDGDKKYVLIPVTGNKEYTFFSISEQYLRRIASKDLKINYMYNENICDLIDNRFKYKLTESEKGNKEIKRQKKEEKRKLLNNKKNINYSYKPYCIEVSYDLSGSRTISKVGKPNAHSYEGYLMSSNFIQGKLVHYIIPKEENTEKGPIILEGEKYNFIEFYNKDLIRNKKADIKDGKLVSKNNNEYFMLPQKSGQEYGKPIFFGEFKNKIYFGFSPYLRIPYDYSIKDGISDKYKNKKGISFMESLFGFTNKGELNQNYKSRLSFEDNICSSAVVEEKVYELVLGEPHATSYPSYLKQNVNASEKEIKNYNSEGFRIRGIKEYWIKDFVSDVSREDIRNNEIKTYINPISIGNTFKGKIHFKNLTRAELGLLTWALKVDDMARENIGMGKPYGFGHVEINNIDVHTENIGKKYSSMTKDYYEKEDRINLIDNYKKFILNEWKINLDKEEGIKELLTLKTNVISAEDKNEVRYMKLSMLDENYKKGKGDNEFNKIWALPSAEEEIRIINKEQIIKRMPESTLDRNRNNSGYKKQGDNTQAKPSNSQQTSRENYQEKRSRSSQQGKDGRGGSRSSNYSDGQLNNNPFASLKDMKFDE